MHHSPPAVLWDINIIYPMRLQEENPDAGEASLSTYAHDLALHNPEGNFRTS